MAEFEYNVNKAKQYPWNSSPLTSRIHMRVLTIDNDCPETDGEINIPGTKTVWLRGSRKSFQVVIPYLILERDPDSCCGVPKCTPIGEMSRYKVNRSNWAQLKL